MRSSRNILMHFVVSSEHHQTYFLSILKINVPWKIWRLKRVLLHFIKKRLIRGASLCNFIRLKTLTSRAFGFHRNTSFAPEHTINARFLPSNHLTEEVILAFHHIQFGSSTFKLIFFLPLYKFISKTSISYRFSCV